MSVVCVKICGQTFTKSGQRRQAEPSPGHPKPSSTVLSRLFHFGMNSALGELANRTRLNILNPTLFFLVSKG
jgi:hypothetical protein